MSAICSAGPPLRLATITLLTLPLASACALTAQIISSRQPLPTSVLETPMHVLGLGLAPSCSRRTPHVATAATTPRAPQAAARSRAAPIDPNCHPLLLLDWLRADREVYGHLLRTTVRERPVRVLQHFGVRGARARRRPRRRAAATRPRRRPTALVRTGGSAPRSTSSSRRPDLDRVRERDGRERRARADRRVEAVDVDERVRRRRAEVEHDVGVVEQARARRVLRRRRLATARRT